MNLDDIFDVGRQHSHEGGEWVRSDTCVRCNLPIPAGSSWCPWHHPARPLAFDLGTEMTVEELGEAIAELQRVLGRNWHG